MNRRPNGRIILSLLTRRKGFVGIDENRVRQLHLVETFVIRDVFERGLRVASHVDEHVRRAADDKVRSQTSDQALDHVRQDARHTETEFEVTQDVDEVDGAASPAEFGDDEGDVGNDDEEDDEEPSGDGGVEIWVANGLIVAKESSLGRRNEVEFEDGQERDGDDRQHDATRHRPTPRTKAAK